MCLSVQASVHHMRSLALSGLLALQLRRLPPPTSPPWSRSLWQPLAASIAITHRQAAQSECLSLRRPGRGPLNRVWNQSLRQQLAALAHPSSIFYIRPAISCGRAQSAITRPRSYHHLSSWPSDLAPARCAYYRLFTPTTYGQQPFSPASKPCCMQDPLNCTHVRAHARTCATGYIVYLKQIYMPIVTCSF